MTTLPKRRDRAVQIKQAAQSLIAAHGTWEMISDFRIRGCRVEGVEILFTTPFSVRRQSSQYDQYIAELVGQRWKLDETYQIEIWFEEAGRLRKVFGVAWAPDREPDFTIF